MNIVKHLAIIAVIEIVYITIRNLIAEAFVGPFQELFLNMNRALAFLLGFIYLTLFLKKKISSSEYRVNYEILKSKRAKIYLTGLSVLFLAVPFLASTPVKVDSSHMVLLVAGSVIVAFHEELVFRVLLFKYTQKSFGFWGSAVFSTIFFTLFHLGFVPTALINYVEIGVAGLFLALIYSYSRSFLLIVFLHTMYDTLWLFEWVELGSEGMEKFGVYMLFLTLALSLILLRPYRVFEKK
jgi:membrane protease YdiL (CAAX protease family)